MALQYVYDSEGNITGVEDDGVPVDISQYGDGSQFGIGSGYDPVEFFNSVFPDDPNRTAADQWLSSLASGLDTGGWFDTNGNLTPAGQEAITANPVLRDAVTQGSGWGAAFNRFLGLGGPTGTGTGALSTATLMGAGATGLLGTLAALTQRPQTSTQHVTNSITNNQNQTGNTSQSGTSNQSGTSSQTGATSQTGTTSQSGSTSQAGTTSQIVGGPEWYRNLTENLGTAISGTDKTWSDVMDYLGGGTSQARDISAAALDQYMNPYIERVLNPNLDRLTEDYLRDQNKRDANAAMVGAFGQSRNILENNLAGERYDKVMAETTNNALKQAYDNAMVLFGGDRAANQWGTSAINQLFNSLRPETSTVGTTSQTGTALQTGTSGTTGTSSQTGTTSQTGATSQTGTSSQTGGTTQTGSTGQTVTGTDPNMFGSLANLAGQVTQLLNPPIVRTTTTTTAPAGT